MLPKAPAAPIRTPWRRKPLIIAVAISGAGVFDGAVAHEFEAEEKSGAAHVADRRVPIAERAQALREIGAGRGGVLHQSLVAITSSTASPAAAATGLPPNVLKYFTSAVKRSSRSGARGDAAHREAVAHRLAHRDDVGDDPVALETPHAGAGAPEAWLHLVGDEEAAVAARRLDRGLEKARRVGEHAVAREDRIGQKAREPDAALFEIGDGGFERGREALAEVRRWRPVGVRRRNRRGHAAASGFPGREDGETSVTAAVLP